LPAWLTLLGSILLLLMAVAFIFFVARGCVATQESTQVRKYVTSSASLLSDSSNIGNETLQPALAAAEGDPGRLDREELNGAASDSRMLYERALDNEEVPPEFEDVHHYVVSSLGIRADATERLAAAAGGNPDNFTETFSSVIEDYRVSDSIIRNQYLPASQKALEEAGQQGNQGYLEEPEPFMDYEETGFDGASNDTGAVVRDDPNALHGVEVTSVEVGGQPLLPGGNVVLTGDSETVFTVTVTNGGEVVEQAVPVEVILNTKAERQSQKTTIESIEANGGVKTVEVSGFIPGEYNETADVTVEVGPVEYEETEDNNVLTGTVTFGI
jgi:hypothetical protein